MKFKPKVFVSLLLTLSFFLAVLSGIMLYLSPRGRIANWTDWTLLGATKDGWTDLHLIAIVIMLVTGLLHLFWFNWKLFLTYLGRSAKGALRYPRELLVSILLFVLLSVGVIYQVPGAYVFTNLRNTILDSYEKPDDQPPIPHAEELTLDVLARDILSVSFDDVRNQLTSAGWEAPEEQEKVGVYAARAGVSPDELYAELEPLRREKNNTSPIAARSQFTHGGGIGKITLQQFCDQQGITLRAAQWALVQSGVKEAASDDTMKDVASVIGKKPGELAEVILGQLFME